MGYLHGIQIKEGAKNVLMSAGDTSVIALVGTAPQGAVGTVKLITSAEAAVYNRQNEKCQLCKTKSTKKLQPFGHRSVFSSFSFRDSFGTVVQVPSSFWT